MAKNRFSLWQRISKPEWRPIQAAVEEQAQAISNLEAATTSTTPTNGCLATVASAVTVTPSTFTTVDWDTASWNPQDELDTTTGIFTAAAAGWYSMSMQVLIGSLADTKSYRGLFSINGTGVGWFQAGAGRTGDVTVAVFIAAYPLNAGDTVATQVYHQDTVNRTTGTGFDECIFSIIKIGDL